MENQRGIWVISAAIEATEQDAGKALAAIEHALCPDPEHAGYCPVPWTTMRVRFDDLDPAERAGWEASFAEKRQRARDAGAEGA